MPRSAYAVSVVLIGVAGLALLWAVVKNPRRPDRSRPTWHYILLWPLILEKRWERKGTSGRIFTNRELIGWSVVIVLLIVVFVFGL
jgi:hypothetical protein